MHLCTGCALNTVLFYRQDQIFLILEHHSGSCSPACLIRAAPSGFGFALRPQHMVFKPLRLRTGLSQKIAETINFNPRAFQSQLPVLVSTLVRRWCPSGHNPCKARGLNSLCRDLVPEASWTPPTAGRWSRARYRRVGGTVLRVFGKR